MKNTLMVYYSLEGNTACAADFLGQYPEIDTERLLVEKEPPKSGFGKFLLGGKSALMKQDPGLKPLTKDPLDYENIIIGFPVWAGTYPPAIGAFLKRYDLKQKNIYVVACSASGNADKAIDHTRRSTPECSHKGAVSLKDPLKDQETAFAKLRELAEEINKS
jgi:flavodoxin